jgi:MFS family permease
VEPLGAGARVLTGYVPLHAAEASSGCGEAQRGEGGGGLVELLVGDVGVAADGREIRVTEVGSDEARVSGLLPQLRSRGVAIELALTRSVALAVGGFFLTSLAAGIRTPASGSLGLEQLPGHPGAMMAARTAATQIGYLVGAVVGGAVITAAGYGAFGFLLAAGMDASAVLVLRLDDDPHSLQAS